MSELRMSLFASMARVVIACPLMAQVPAASSTLQTDVGPVAVTRLATLDNPWGMAFLPDGRLLISEKPGRLRMYAQGRVSSPISGVPRVAYREQGGLLDVEIDPAFARNSFVYIYYTERADNQPGGRFR